MIIESLRYLYILLMNNQLLKQHFHIYQSSIIQNFIKEKSHYNNIIKSSNIKQSVNRGK